MDERALTERLVTYDTSTLEGMQSAAGFVKGWLEARDVEVTGTMHNGRPVLAATVGRAAAPTVVFHGHLDVVPGGPELFEPRVVGDRLYGRGAYDMKGGLASMMCALRDVADQDLVRVHFLCVSDEESEEENERGSDYLVEQGYSGDFAITGEPTDLHIGIQAKGVLAHEDRGQRAPRRTAPPPGSGTTPCSRPSTSSARSSRCPSRASPRTSSTGPRSTSAGSWGATRSTACPTPA